MGANDTHGRTSPKIEKRPAGITLFEFSNCHYISLHIHPTQPHSTPSTPIHVASQTISLLAHGCDRIYPPPLHLEPLLSRITSDPDPSYYWTSGACPWPSPPLVNSWPPPQLLLSPQNFRHQLLSYPNLNHPHHFMLTPPPLQIFCIPWGRISMHFFQHHHWRPPF